MTQRWRERRDSYRPAREVIDPTRYGVEPISESEAKTFVVRHHYSGTFPAARCRVGLFRTRPFEAPELVGAAIFAVPAQQNTVSRYAPGARDGVVLSRFVLLDDIEANAETWLLARAFKVLRAELPQVEAVISYSDPLQRLTAEGRLVMPGHIGTIYQAHNGRYLGRSGAETLHLGPDGRVVSRRALGKIRLEHRGAAYAYRQLLELGAPERQPMESGPDYVARALREGPFRRIRHPGNHVYAWPLASGIRLAEGRSYPKLREAA